MPKDQEKVGFRNFNGKLQGKVSTGFEIEFYEGKQNKPYLTISKEEWLQTVQNARQQSQSYWEEWELLTQLYEKKMQEMAATDPNIARIWKEYLKRRDSNETDIKQTQNTSVESEQEER